MRAISFLFSISVLCAGLQSFAAIDDSVDIFFPKSLKYLQYSQTEFPVFWWNFVVIDGADGGKTADFAKATEVCELLKKYEGKQVKRLICGDQIGQFAATLQDWADDVVLRAPYSDVKSTIEGSLGEMSFISSDKKDFFMMKRHDPLDQWQIYLEKAQAFSNSFERQQGFLLDAKTQRLVIPLQFGVAPKMKNTEDLVPELQKIPGVHFVGAHGASYSNEKQVHEDMEIVSIVGVVVLIAFIGFLVLKGRLAALLLFPPVAVAMALAGWLTELCFGSIHGLTLAFGSGIIGLAVDYGLHGAFNSESHQTWKSNAIGFFTTLVGLGIMVFSGIPLIRQMMVFSVFGLLFGFLFFYLLCKYLPKYFSIASIELKFPAFKSSWVVVLILIICGVYSSFRMDLSFDLRKFNYQSAGDTEATQWFFTQGEHKENFLLLHEPEDLYVKTTEEAAWAKERGIQYVGLGDYLPSADVQEKNLLSWRAGCPALKKNLSATAQKVYAPFLENICSDQHKALTFADLKAKDYVNQLVGHDKFISLFFAKNAEEEKQVKEKFTEAHSLVESIKGFSDSLEKDLRWMIPAAFLLCTAILFLYYRRWKFVLSAYVPFLTGLGLFFVVTLVKGGSLDLISVLGLLMVFGFSLDYGIFSTDIYVFPQGAEDEPIVYSALGLAALSNVIGFFPLVFAKHPILHQLGVALFFGTIGTYLGTMWGVKPILGRKTES